MKSIPAYLMLLCCSIIGNAAATEDWLVIQTATPNITFSIDRSSLEKNGNLVKFREKMTYAKPEIRDEVSGHLIAEKKMHRVVNCAEQTQGLIHGSTYAEHGRFITSISVDEATVNMSEIPPNTIAAIEFTLVCGAVAPAAGHDDKPAAPQNP